MVYFDLELSEHIEKRIIFKCLEFRLTLYRLSSNSSNGPVAPMMISGWPASNAKKIPATDVDRSVSDMPIRLLVLSPTKKYWKGVLFVVH
jgi:hypothetical protein